ncbi:MAG: relaxase/mobilization nuclease domain-containing protein, partial [Prochloraceae cyanobacterium]|nr:relaxase/mobilization nuclease domain-containing protein [Prochloraceae cyanobacterium]
MIGNITKGSSFKPLLKYVLEKDLAQLLCSNMLGENYTELAAEFNLSSRLRPTVTRPVYHISLSLDPTEKLSPHDWEEVALKYKEQMGFKNSQFVAVLHRDRPHDHLHIVTNRVDLDGNIVNSSYDYYRSQKVIRDLEREFLIRQIPCSWEVPHRQQTRQEIEKINRTGNKSVRRHLQKTIDHLVENNSPLTLSQLLKHLEERDIDHHVHYSPTGALQGLSYSHKRINFAGTSLGEAYTFGGLQKQLGIVCDPQIEREIYNTCTISPNTDCATIELLNQLQLQQQLAEERARIAREEELIRFRDEQFRKKQEIERQRIKLEKEREKQRIASLNQQINDLAPIFTPCIQYTHLQGVPISEAPAFKALNHIHKTIWNEPVDDGLCVETKNYIITIKANTKNEPILSLNDQLEIGLNCYQLRVERKDNYEDVLSINYRDYEELDTNNIYVVENQLTTDDQQRLKSLQKAVNDYQ